MNITIEINCDNAAFEDDAGREVARILADLASKLPRLRNPAKWDGLTLCDINGNTVGKVTVEE